MAGTAKTALTALESSGIGSGALSPIEIVAPRGERTALPAH